MYHIYPITDTRLVSVAHAAYLATELGDKLTWTKYTDHTTAKPTRTCKCIRQNVYVTSQIKETAYKILVRPSLDYACTWSNVK